MIWTYLIASYFVGNLMFGYLVSKFIYHQDIRIQGSRNVGARNAGRVYGKKAFILIFLGDAIKGIIVVLCGKFLNFSESVQLLALGMAILGHIKPAVLKFKGGKGISTFIGGIIAFEPINVIVIIIAFLLTIPFTKSFTFSGLGALFMIPIFLYIKGYTFMTCIILLCIIILLLIAHMENIKERLSEIGKKE
ncbi:glycerol-3-phosphate acyltransferase [Neobacillus sp. D3-1R]|uniref:glycerol-3-phosphate acyltransferase n=1 Tax=Neobacillus sp. D3-1R TaxID=3445778 RepID=UPI003FA14F83